MLSDFWAEDRAWLEPLIEALAIEAPLLLKGDGSAYMSRVAYRLAPPKPTKPEKEDDAADQSQHQPVRESKDS